MFATPVVYIFFNRPEVTRRTFAEVRKAKPAQLYLIADGPRPHKPTDAERVTECRSIVETMIDWPCEVTRDYSDVNLGCGKRIATGLTRAFAALGEAIVIEDDILPHPDFFTFCADMLERHRDNPRVHAISGFNPIGKFASGTGSAVPTLFYSMWGWASWQRAWKDYTFDMNGWEATEQREKIKRFVNDDLIYQFHAHNFTTMTTEKLDTWDYQWVYTMLREQRFAISSTTNLVENLGFHADATHTTNSLPFIHGLRTYPKAKPSRRPPSNKPDRLHDKIYGEIMMTPSPRKIALLRAASRYPLAVRLLRKKWG